MKLVLRVRYALMTVMLLIPLVALPVPASAQGDVLLGISASSGSLVESVRTSFIEWYKNTYGKDLTFDVLTPGGTSVVVDKIRAWGGNPDADVVFDFELPTAELLKEEGYFEPYEAPESKHIPNDIRGSKLKDPDHYWTAFGIWKIFLFYNTKALKKYALPVPETWEDLTNPIYRGHIVSCIPYASGTMHMWTEMILQHFGEEKGWALMRRLAANYGRFSTGSTDTERLVERGEYTFGIAQHIGHATQALSAGFPVKLTPLDLTLINLMGVALLKGAKHPETAKIFINWLLSMDGQKAVCNGGYPPVRPEFKFSDYADEMPMAAMMKEALGTDSAWEIPAEVNVIQYDEELATSRWDEVDATYEQMIFRKWDELKSTLALIEETEAELVVREKQGIDVTAAKAKIAEAYAAFDIGNYAKARVLAKESVPAQQVTGPSYELYAAIIVVAAVIIVVAAILYRRKRVS